MQPVKLLAALVLLATVAACDPGPASTPVTSSRVALPGERSANAALATPPDEWARPTQTAQVAMHH